MTVGAPLRDSTTIGKRKLALVILWACPVCDVDEKEPCRSIGAINYGKPITSVHAGRIVEAGFDRPERWAVYGRAARNGGYALECEFERARAKLVRRRTSRPETSPRAPWEPTNHKEIIMAKPICAVVAGSLEGTTHQGVLEGASFSNSIENANGHIQSSTPVLPADNKGFTLATAAVQGKAGDVQKVFLLVSTVAVNVQLNGGVVWELRGTEPAILIVGGPEITAVQVIGVAATAEGHVSMTKIVGAP